MLRAERQTLQTPILVSAFTNLTRRSAVSEPSPGSRGHTPAWCQPLPRVIRCVRVSTWTDILFYSMRSLNKRKQRFSTPNRSVDQRVCHAGRVPEVGNTHPAKVVPCVVLKITRRNSHQRPLVYVKAVSTRREFAIVAEVSAWSASGDLFWFESSWYRKSSPGLFELIECTAQTMDNIVKTIHVKDWEFIVRRFSCT